MQRPTRKPRAVWVSIERVTFGHEGMLWTAALVTERCTVLDITKGRRDVTDSTWLYFWADTETRRLPWFPEDWWTLKPEQLIELLRQARPCRRPNL